jgi:sugar phosphate isomerase/epimerase
MIKLALQLYTVRKEIEADLEGTLAKISEIGYSGVEFYGGYYGLEADEMKALLDKNNLKAVSSHVNYEQLEADLQKHINYMKALGANHITLPSLPNGAKDSEMTLLHVAAELEDMGRKAKQKGISLSFHNHREEFETVFSGRTVEQILIDEAPNLNFEVDTGWSAVAGVDNKEFLTRLGYRLDLVHIKDVDNEDIPVEIGEGRLNIKAVFDTANKLAVRWCIVEQDCMRDYPTFESIKRSYDNIQEKYIRFLEK